MYDNHSTVLELLEKAQEADHDNREKVREVHHFMDKPDGQWEPDVAQSLRGRPRYTLDQTNDIVDDIAGELQGAEFGIKVRPAGGEATKDTAKLYDGMIRNIQARSNALHIYNQAGRSMVAAGMDGWEVIQKYGENDSFDQDLFIRKIPNFVDSVWFDTTSVEQDRSDSRHAFKLESISIGDYDKKYPDGSRKSVSDGRTEEVYNYKDKDNIIIGQVYYKVEVEREIVEMTNGSVYIVDDKFESVQDELAEAGVTVKRSRKRKIDEVRTRLFDGGGWLKDEQKTVFTDYIPLIPTYGNFKISENKVIYWGAITKKMDAQRIYNYSESRKIEEGALAPRAKLLMTREQAQNDVASLERMNTSADPVQFYTHVPDQPQPYMLGGPTVNPGLDSISNTALQNLKGNLDNPNRPVGLMSGTALERAENSEDIKNIKYFASQEVAIAHTAKILVNAIPKVYDTARQVRVLSEDGSADMVTIHDRIWDQETQQMVELNDISQGVYDVVCAVGPAFKNRQSESTAAFMEVAGIDPAILQSGKDILFKNMSAPGMDLMADRFRAQLFQQGMIPPDQWTDEEREMVAQQQAAAQGQEQQPDPLMVAAQAELLNAQSSAQEREFNQQLELMKMQNEQLKTQLDFEKFNKSVEDKSEIEAIKLGQGQQKLDLEAEKQDNDLRTKLMELSLKLTDLETQVGRDLSAQNSENAQDFDMSTMSDEELMRIARGE